MPPGQNPRHASSAWFRAGVALHAFLVTRDGFHLTGRGSSTGGFTFLRSLQEDPQPAYKQAFSPEECMTDKPRPPMPLYCAVGKDGRQSVWNADELRRYLAVTTDTVFYIKTDAGEVVPMLVERLRQALAVENGALPHE
jgi:hypothetical protein